MRFKDKPVIFIIFILIILFSFLAGLVDCGQSQQNMAGSSPDSPVPLNKEESFLTFVRMVDAKIGWASTPESILKTVDGGENWAEVTPQGQAGLKPFREFQTSIVDARHAFVSNGYELFYSADGMRTFTSVKPNIDLTNLSQLDFVSDLIGWGIINGCLWKTTDGGHVWTQMTNQSLSQTAIESSINNIMTLCQ